MKLTIFLGIVICLIYVGQGKHSAGKGKNSAKGNDVKETPVKAGKGKNSDKEKEFKATPVKAGKGKHLGRCTTDAQCPPGTVCSRVSSNKSKGFKSARKCYPSLGICESSPCLNNGTCVDYENGTFTCICDSGYTGANCSDPRVQNCPSGWSLFRAHCYFFSTDSKTWFQADDYCEAAGGYLVEINTTAEILHVYNNGMQSPWTGLNDILAEGNLVWTTGSSSVLLDVNDNYDAYDCVYILRTYSWYADDCADARPYVCEMDDY